MGDNNKSREQLAEELSQARRRIAELETSRGDEFRTLPVGYDTFKVFFDSATDSFSIWDSNMKMVYINDITLEKYYPAGTTRADIIGKHFTELIPGSVESGRYERYLNVLKTGEPVYIDEFQPHTRFGDMYLSIKVFKIENGLGVITTDITERKRMEQELRASQQRLTALIDNAPDIIFSYDSVGRFISVNRRAEELLGYTGKELSGKTFRESNIFTPESLDKAERRIKSFEQGQITTPTPYEIVAKNGTRIFVEARALPILQHNETEIIAIARDITERRKTEDALRQSEEKLRAVFESIGDSITVVDLNGNIIDLNDAALKLFGCKSKEEVLGMSGLTFIVEENRPPVIEAIPVRCVQYRFKRMDGSTFWGETSSDILRDKSGDITGFIGIVRDISDRKKTEESLRHSEEKFRVIFKSIADGISVIDLTTGKVIDTNEAALRMFNFDREDVIGMNAYELIAEKDRQRAMEDLVNTLQTGDSGLAEWCLLGKGGTEHDCEARASVIRDESWNPLYLVNVMRDITERKKMGEKLRQSEETLRRVFDSIDDGVSVTDLEGNVLDVNEKALELSGYNRDEFIGKFGLELLAERDRARAVQDMLNTFNTGRSGLREYSSLTKDGREFPAEARATVLYDSAGRPVGLVSVLRDITERKQMEQKLRQSEEKIRQIFNSVGVGITVTDMEGKVVEVNDFGLRLCGYSKEEMIGRNGIGIIAEKDRPRIIAAMIEAFQAGKSVIQEFTALKNDGAEYEVEAIATVLSDGPGKPTGLIISITDISERKRIEGELNDYKANLEKMVEERTSELAVTYEKLRESEERLRVFFENVPDIIFAHNMKGCFTDINKKALEISGYSRDEIIGNNILETGILPPDQIEDVMAGLKGIEEGRSGYPYEVQLMRKGGGRFTVEAVSFPIRKKGELEVMGIARDITERKLMEEALRNSEEKLRTMFASMADGVVVTDLEGKVKDANKAVLRLFGFDNKEDVLGMNGFDFMAEEDYDLAMNDMIQLFSEGLVTGRSWTFKHHPDGEFQAELSTALLKDSKGNPTDILVVMRDITERKRMEEALRESEEKLRATFESIADGIAVIDLNGKLIDVNTADARLFGYESKDQLTNRDALNFIAEAERDRVINDIAKVLATGVGMSGEYRLVDRNGREFDAEVRGSVLRNSPGETIAIVNTIRDITERKRMEEALRESEEKLRAIYNSIGDGITVTDLKGNILDMNEAGLRFSGFSKKEEAIGRNGLLFISETDRDRARNDMFNVLQKGIGITTEYRLVDKEGKEFDAEVSGAMICDAEGKPSAIVNVIRDITERKRIEQALMESEAKYRTLVEQSEQGICILQNGRIVFANNGLAKINGYSLKELYNMSPEELLDTIHPEDREAYVERVKRRLQGEKMMPRHEYRMIRKDGTKRQLETYAKRITYKGQPAIQSTIEDITERKQWAEKLEKSKEELKFYVTQITRAQEEERKRIARELHDDTIQELITLSRDMDDLTELKIKPEEDFRDSRRKIEAARQKVDTILKSVRQFTRDLRPSVLDDLGLVPALEWLTADMSNRFGIPINTSIIGSERSLDPDTTLSMFRIVQESLTNAGRHAQASQIQVNLKFTRKTATLSIIDDGKGFTPPKQISRLTKLGKLGIAGMYERAQLIGATLSIKSNRNKGTTISLELPIK
ncbi:MAG: PAS domain S-box protein [Dehalococcoidia bacterium]